MSFAARVVDTIMQIHNVNLYISYIKNRNLHIKSNTEKNSVVPKPPKPNRQAKGSTELRARIRNISTPESVVYNARKSLQMYPYSKDRQRNWERIRSKYLPVLGADRFYKVMELADMDSIKSNIEKNSVVPKPPKPNRQAKSSTELRARIRNISTPESVVYNARKSLQMYPHSKNHQSNWARIRGKYLPVLGADRFYKVMELADMDSF